MNSSLANKPIHRSPALIDSRKLAEFWKIARVAMDRNQHGSEAAKTARILSFVDYLGIPKSLEARVLDAACGTGYTLGAALADTREWSLSDGDGIMVDTVISELSGKGAAAFALACRVKRSYWHELRTAFHSAGFDLAFVNGNALPYVCTWGENKSMYRILEEGENALLDSFAGIRSVLKQGGAFVFDLARQEGTDFSLGEVELERRVVGIYMRELDISTVRPFMRAYDSEGIRHWEFGTDEWSDSWKGVAIDLALLTRLLQTAGFHKPEKIPDSLVLDPKYYDMYMAIAK